MPKVFVTRKIPEKGLELLKNTAEVRVWEGEEPVPRQVLLNEVKDVDGLLSLLTETIDEEVMEAGENLKVISNYAVGYDNIDVKAATQRGIMVTNTPGVLTQATADLTFALILAAARRIVEGVDYVKAGKWKTWGPELLLGRDVYGSTLGIIGLGRIGQAVAERARGFNMKVLYYSRRRKPDVESKLELHYVSLDDLLKKSDFVSIHIALNDETRYLIDYDAFEKMKPSAFLINTARGGVVNPKALYQALVNRKIAGAALDVTEPEPIQPKDPILDLDNVIVLPHIGSATVRTRTRMAVMAAENLTAALKGETPPYLINKEVLKKG